VDRHQVGGIFQERLPKPEDVYENPCEIFQERLPKPEDVYENLCEISLERVGSPHDDHIDRNSTGRQERILFGC